VRADLVTVGWAGGRFHGDAERRRVMHHFRWNACSFLPPSECASSELRTAPLHCSWLALIAYPHLDTKTDPRKPKIIRVLEPQRWLNGPDTRAHAVHCGPEGIYVAALGNAQGEAPGGSFLMDHETSRFEADGKSTVGRSNLPTTRGDPWATQVGHERVGLARDLRERVGS
jgi:hypothetical protein